MTIARTTSFVASLALSAALSAPAAAAPAAAPDARPAAPQAAPATTKERLSFAVVIGNNKSLGRRRPELRYADDDAARYFEILQTMAPGRVWLLTELDRDTTRLFPEAAARAVAPHRRTLDAVGRELAERMQKARAAGHETELYFVFAGHGDVERGEGFIELADARFRSSELEAFLRGIPFTRAHVLLDSCNSFFMLGVRKPGGRHFATSEDAARALAARLPNVGVFLSTSAEGEAFEWSEIQSGIFSHVVRSGLLGGADADGDGSVSYLELAAFVATATADVKNPNMRPQVFARGPGAEDKTPIAHLHSMSPVRRFELAAGSTLRLRLRDANGLPLLDSHVEAQRTLKLNLPEAWARGAVVERAEAETPAGTPPVWRRVYAVPEAPETVTLAALQSLDPRGGARGPEETFQALFSRPFGARALATYEKERSTRGSPRVFGVSREDAQRMELVLDQLARTERGRRVNEAVGGIGFGALLTGAGIGVLHVDDDATSKEKTEAHVLGGTLLGLGGLFMLGGAGSLFTTTTGEQAAAEFRRIRAQGGDPAQAFAAANKRLEELSAKRKAERYAEGFFGALVVIGSTTGLIWSEIAADEGDDRMAPRLGWSAGILGGGLMITDAALTETPVDTITRIWRDDPSLNQYQPVIHVNGDGAFFGLSGTL
jgi:hypothetical protein